METFGPELTLLGNHMLYVVGWRFVGIAKGNVSFQYKFLKCSSHKLLSLGAIGRWTLVFKVPSVKRVHSRKQVIALSD